MRCGGFVQRPTRQTRRGLFALAMALPVVLALALAFALAVAVAVAVAVAISVIDQVPTGGKRMH
jgi:hypothetical protein